jgi:hypothetical protein
MAGGIPGINGDGCGRAVLYASRIPFIVQITTAAELVARRPSIKSELFVPSPTPLDAASATTAKEAALHG